MNKGETPPDAERVVRATSALTTLSSEAIMTTARNETEIPLAADPSSVGPEQLRARWTRLPEPIRRYLGYAILPHAPAIRTAHLRHDGFFRTKPEQRWLKIKGDQYFTIAEPGFVWKAKVWPFPFIWISARDLLYAGHGNMLVKLFSTFTLADASGAEIDQGATLRWLAENIWFPFGLVSDPIEWEPIDAQSARAVIRSRGKTASAVVNIDNEGKLVSLRADRYRDIGGGLAVLTPWTAHCSEYHEFNGFRVPTSVEVSWVLENGPFSYARFHVTSLEYNVDRLPRHLVSTQ
jgi:hypothetical protein